VVKGAARGGAVSAALIALVLGMVPSAAHAESGKLNLHLDAAFGVPFIGPYAPPDSDDRSRLGPATWASLDMFPNEWIAFEAMIGLGYMFETAATSNEPGAGYWCFALGARGRWLDDMDGYDDEVGGNLAGNFWASAHLG
jgi:hypothetical protein